MKGKMRGNLLLLLTAIVWGAAFVAQSAGMEFVRPFTFNSIRTLLGGLVLIPFMLSRMNKLRASDPQSYKFTIRRSLIGGIGCGTCLAVASSIQQFGVSMTTAGKAGFITALYIVIVPFFGIFIRKRVSISAWICVAIAIVGFYLLSIHEGFTVSLGDLLCLICAAAFAAHILTIDHFNGKGADSVIMSCVQFLFAGAAMLIPMFIFEKPQLSSILQAWVTIGYAGIFSCGVGYTFQIIGQKYTDPTTASLIMSLESVFAAVSGWLILGESMTARELIGCALVFAAVIISQLPSPIEKKQ